MSSSFKINPIPHQTVFASTQSNSVDRARYRHFVYILIGISLLVRVLFIGVNQLLVEEAYYWNYAQHLDFSYLDHPPMVALLIKLSTVIFGTSEFGIRVFAILCWLLMAFFSFKLTECVSYGAGKYAVLLLAILPYFFMQSVVMTPDLPLLVAWSGALYCLYRALILNESSLCYAAGFWIGLGMLSKYTICLLGPATLLYVILVPSARVWLMRKELYLSGLLAMVLFTPVIYWNANHEWVSFLFQSTRRMNDLPHFCFHYFLGLLLLFLTPLGVLGLCSLFRKNTIQIKMLPINRLRFFQVYLMVPLIFFGVISVRHPIRLTWIGPCLLAVVPWLAMLLHQSAESLKPRVLKMGLFSGACLILFYSGMFVTIVSGRPEIASELFFNNFFDWRDFTAQVHAIVKEAEKTSSLLPIIIPLDAYNIASELNVYQEILFAQGAIQKRYQVEGQHYFGENSLMYQYWSKNDNLRERPVLLLSRDQDNFKIPRFQGTVMLKSPILRFWAHSQGKGDEMRPYYYQWVEMK